MTTSTDTSINTTSMLLTPQAVDDYYSFSEDDPLIRCIDVMSNDLGGKAKSLFSLTDGAEDDLDAQDICDLISSDVGCGWEMTTLGAQIKIENGKIIYDATGIEALVQSLAVGESKTDTITYAIRLGNGTLSLATLTVEITGKNDAPTVSFADSAGAVTEDDAAPDLTDTGTITFDDVDLSDTHTVSVSASVTNSLGGVLAATITDPATDAGDGTVTWNYTLANSATQYLGQGDEAYETFTVTISDGYGGTVSQDVTVTVTGTNDQPDLTVDATGGVIEDASTPDLSVTGALSIADVDVGDSHVVTSAYNGDAVWSGGGSLPAGVEAALAASFTADGSGWDFTVANDLVQFLGKDETITLSFDVTADDQSGAANATDTETVTITITGVNDVASISVTVGGNYDVVEAGGIANGTPGDPSASGDLDISDADFGEAKFQAALAADLQGDYGTFTFDEDTGAWTYALDQDLADSLNGGDAVTDALTVTSFDGTDSETITVNITGANDAAEFSGDESGSVTEATGSSPGVPSVAGNLDVTDVDDGEAAFQAVTSPAASANGFGFFTVTANGDWNYALDNSNPTVDALNTGGSLGDSFVVKSVDGTEKTVNITINGATDAVTVSVPAPYTGPDADPNDHDELDINGVALTTSASTPGNTHQFNGSSGADTIVATDDDATGDGVNAQGGGDTVYGRGGDDFIQGQNGADLIFGGSGSDTISGGNDNDTIYGGSGIDVIDGGGGTDIIVGGFGADQLTGGTGNDTFVYLDLRDTGDTITDFQGGGIAGGDKIDLSAIDANTSDVGDTAFIFGGTTATAHGVWYAQDASNNWTNVYADTDGNTATAELYIKLTGLISLTQGDDFVL